MRFSFTLLVLIAAALAMVPCRVVHACAVCGLPIGDPKTHAFRVSVLFMMAVPYAIVAAGALIGWMAYRNARRRVGTAARIRGSDRT